MAVFPERRFRDRVHVLGFGRQYLVGVTFELDHRENGHRSASNRL